jgi:hypothetical protein
MEAADCPVTSVLITQQRILEDRNALTQGLCEELFENLSRKYNFCQNLTKITGTLYEDPSIFLIISR